MSWLRIAGLSVAAGALVAACGSSFPHPSSADVATLRPSDPAVRLEDLERGRTLYMGKCGSCHLLHAPATIAPEEWPGKVTGMRSEGRVHLEDDEVRDIIRYLRSASASARL